jgi:endonuclease/exonuclease/phosphatase family metal-dependent hydrolase
MQPRFGLAAVAIVLAACGDDGLLSVGDGNSERRSNDWLGPSKDRASITVMTRNIHVGTDVDRIIEAEHPEDIPLLVAEAFQTLLATNFPERAEAFAREILETDPHLIGLQEISLIRHQSPGDAVFGGASPAEDILFDFLDILLRTLQGYGLDYRAVAKIQNADVELPMITGVDPLAFKNVRLTDFDVILARGDVEISNVEAKNYLATLDVPDGQGGIAFEIPRGFTAVDATVGHNTVRFVNTHLEPASLDVKQDQADELIETLRDETLPIILVGDLNTPAPEGTVYNTFLNEFYLDAWDLRSNGRNEPGFTANHDNDLRDEFVDLHERIDLILVRNRPGAAPKSAIGSVFAIVVGDELQDRTPSGLWPSDHAGVVARMVIPRLGGGIVAQDQGRGRERGDG